MAITIQSTNEQKVKVTITPKSASGRPAPLQAGSFTVTVLQGEATVEALTDNSFYARSQDTDPTPETLDTVYALSGDADLGEGVIEITDTVTYHVTGPQAAELGTTASPPEPK